MDKKTEKRIKSRGLDNLQMAASTLQDTNEKIKERGQEYSTENNITFAFTLPVIMIAYIKELVITKLSEDYSYNESSAVREGIQLLKLVNPNIEQRPDDLPISTKKGRKSTADKKIIKKSTSFLISADDQNFIYNFIYKEQKGGGIFKKEEFFSLLIEQLELKYNLNGK